jgi:isopentenyldiphosphate isomerase/intracellular septation protein A
MKLDKRILVNLLPGLLPLLVFILADEIWGTDIGLMVAVGFGVLELFFTYFKTRRFEKFILLDIGLLTLLGAISILFNNDIFFKLKPAFIEIIFAILIAVSVFGRRNILLEMSKRYMKDVKLTSDMGSKMNKSLKTVFFIILAHIILVVYAAFYMSKEAWGFISGVLFYLIFAAYFLVEIIRARRIRKKFMGIELLPILNSQGEIIGKAPRDKFHLAKGEKLLHPVVHLHVFNSRAELFLQHRPGFKLIQPDKWDTAVGGHVSYGEDIETALKREAFEEIGLSDYKPILVEKYIWETDAEKEMVFMFFCVSDQIPHVNPKEVDEGRFWKLEEIRNNLEKNLFTPNFIHELQILQKRGIIKLPD